MTKKEISSIVSLCKKGVTFRAGVEIILRVELNRNSRLLVSDKLISKIADSINNLNMEIPFSSSISDVIKYAKDLKVNKEEIPDDSA